MFENSCDIHSSCAQLLEQRGCPIRETGQWLYGSLAVTVACVSWGVPPLVSLDPIRLGQISHCSCIPGIPCCIEPAIYAALQARALCPESFRGGSWLSEIGFHLSRVGRVQGLLPLANAPSARLGHTRLDQVIRYRNIPLPERLPDQGDGPVTLCLARWHCVVCRRCDGWGVPPLPAWILSDWGRSGIVAGILGMP